MNSPLQRQVRRPRFWFTVAVLGSFLIHVGLWSWFERVRLPESSLKSRDKVHMRRLKLQRVEIDTKWMEPPVSPPPQRIASTPTPDHTSLAPTEEKRSFAKLLSEAPASPVVPPGSPQIPQDKPKPTIGAEPTLNDPSLRTQLDQELKATQEQQMKNSTKRVGAGRPVLITKGAPSPPDANAMELAPPSQATVGPSAGPMVDKGETAFTGSSRLDDFFSKGGLPLPPKRADPATLVPQSIKDQPTVPQKFESLNPFLNVELFTQEQVLKTGKREGYFLIRITAKPNPQLKVIPKDVYFLMDISSSIGGERLNTYRATVLSSISKLNPSDRFRILAFRDRLLTFRSDWVPAQNPPLEEIRRWLDDLDTGGVTDFYEGIQPLTQHQSESGRMAMALVMSDGVPTKGQLDSTQIIRELSEANDNKASIFTFSNGRNVNNFLLDLLAYSNQGRLQYSPEVPVSEQTFLQLVEQVRNPLFINLRFRFAGVNGSQVCPQNVPNLYQDSPLLLFGRYTPGQSTPISLQILGESFNSTKELLVELPFPKVPNGPNTLPQTWARQRIYHLLSQMTRSRARQDAILFKVRKLSEAYDVEVPY